MEHIIRAEYIGSGWLLILKEDAEGNLWRIDFNTNSEIQKKLIVTAKELEVILDA